MKFQAILSLMRPAITVAAIVPTSLGAVAEREQKDEAVTEDHVALPFVFSNCAAGSGH